LRQAKALALECRIDECRARRRVWRSDDLKLRCLRQGTGSLAFYQRHGRGCSAAHLFETARTDSRRRCPIPCRNDRRLRLSRFGRRPTRGADRASCGRSIRGWPWRAGAGTRTIEQTHGAPRAYPTTLSGEAVTCEMSENNARPLHRAALAQGKRRVTRKPLRMNLYVT
jgi:hypothetical protein